MTSIYERALGRDEFRRLHPKVRERFGLSSESGVAVGVGVMEEIWHGAAYTLPFLHVGTLRRIMFPRGPGTCPSGCATTPTWTRWGARP